MRFRRDIDRIHQAEVCQCLVVCVTDLDFITTIRIAREEFLGTIDGAHDVGEP